MISYGTSTPNDFLRSLPIWCSAYLLDCCSSAKQSTSTESRICTSPSIRRTISITVWTRSSLKCSTTSSRARSFGYQAAKIDSQDCGGHINSWTRARGFTYESLKYSKGREMGMAMGCQKYRWSVVQMEVVGGTFRWPGQNLRSTSDGL